MLYPHAHQSNIQGVLKNKQTELSVDKDKQRKSVLCQFECLSFILNVRSPAQPLNLLKDNIKTRWNINKCNIPQL